MNPNQQELFRVVLRYIDAGRYIELAIYVLILYLPFAPVVIHRIRTDRKISIVDTHPVGRRYIVHSDALLSAFLELEATLP
jgi:hypothetical protein